MMHKKGFEELAEGAEVAYFASGKVIAGCVEQNCTMLFFFFGI